jgi:hypothetical protein
MTTAQAAFRILRHASVTDIFALSLPQATEVAGALSRALAEYFRFGPRQLSRTSASVQLRAPRTLPALQVSAGAVEVSSGSPFPTSQRGSSLLIDGDPAVNEIVSSVGWLHPYQGTSGERSAVVYGDCLPVSSRLVERIVSDPWVHSPETERRPLARVRDEHVGLRQADAPATGIPERYGIQPAGVSRGATAEYLLRVWPMPDRPVVLKFEADVQPDTIDYSAVAQVPLDLPVSDLNAEAILLPLAEEQLLGSTLLDELRPETAGRIEAAAERARDHLRHLPRDHGKPRQKLRTRPGY